VARPWRLRHKLLLGLALVVGILGTLLAGSVQGLMSYVDSMKATDSKLAELQRAEDLREVAAQLVTPGDPKNPQEEPKRMHQRAQEVREAVTRFEDTHRETIIRGRDVDGDMEDQRIGDLRRFLADFDAAVDHAADEGLTDGSKPLTDAKVVKDSHANIMVAAKEIRSVIYSDMYHRISIAKGHQRRSLFVVITCSTAAVLLMAGMLYFFYGWVFHPIRRLQEGVRHVAQGQYHHPIQLTTGDELEELANAFDDMAAKVQATHTDLVRQVNERSRQLVRSERMVSVGFLAAGVAHEINNPLASIAFCSEGLQRRLHDIALRYPNEGETIQKYLAMIQSEAFRCKEITQNLLEFSRVGERRREPTDLAGLVQGVLEMAQLLPSCRNKQIVFQPHGRLAALINAQDVKSVVLNLVVNALDSMDEGGTVTIVMRQNGPMAELVFHDVGCGMEPEILENIFEPFFTRSRTGKGTGLGLFISHQIIAQHDGTIEAFSEGPGRGSTFTVRMPLQPALTATATPAVPAVAWAVDVNPASEQLAMQRRAA
jgi:two-component system, NtrC family, sensor kinase